MCAKVGGIFLRWGGAGRMRFVPHRILRSSICFLRVMHLIVPAAVY